MDVDFDFLVPWGSEQGQPYGYGVTHDQAQQNLGKIMDRLKSEANA